MLACWAPSSSCCFLPAPRSSLCLAFALREKFHFFFTARWKLQRQSEPFSCQCQFCFSTGTGRGARQPLSHRDSTWCVRMVGAQRTLPAPRGPLPLLRLASPPLAASTTTKGQGPLSHCRKCPQPAAVPRLPQGLAAAPVGSAAWPETQPCLFLLEGLVRYTQVLQK